MNAKLTMSDFLKFLLKVCAEKTSKPESSVPLHSDELAEIKAYKEIAAYIEIFLKEYSEQKQLTRDAEKAFLAAIESDVRRQFDDPVALIQHIQKIASRPPFFDSERVSLSSISAFCNDYIYRHNLAVRQELIQSAPF
jgi:hypothetical protein